METLSAGSICAGIGGLERLLPVEVRWHAEMDPHASKVLERHWPGVPNLGDIKDVDWGAVEPVDVILGGPPCQPISNAGKRRGTEDERWLWPWVWGAVRALRPRYVFLENPAAVAGWLGDVLGGLAEIGGYEARWNCLRASDVGAPHGRLRWFLLARDTDGARTDAYASSGASRHAARQPSSDPAPYAGGWELQRRGERRDMASSALEDQGAGDQRERDGDAVGDRCTTPADTDCGRRAGWTSEQGRGALGGIATQGHRENASADTYLGAVGPEPERWGRGAASGAGSWAGPEVAANAYGTGLEGRGGAGGGGDEQPARPHRPPEQAWGAYEPAVRRWEALTRPAPPPLDGRGRLSDAAVEWMMGFPAGWITNIARQPLKGGVRISRNQALKCLGNAVVSQQARVAWDLLWAETQFLEVVR